MLLWLKVRTVVGEPEVSQAQFDWGVFFFALLAGALIGIAAQMLWAVVAPAVVARFGGEARPRDLRIVWGGSAFPQAIAVAVLLPLDIVISGGKTFTEGSTDALSAAWTGLSAATSLSLGVWSLWVFFRGVETIAGLPAARSLVSVGVAALCLVVVTAAFGVAGVLMSRWS